MIPGIITAASVAAGTDYSTTITAAALPIVGQVVNPHGDQFSTTITPGALPIVGGTKATVHARAITISPAALPIVGSVINPAHEGSQDMTPSYSNSGGTGDRRYLMDITTNGMTATGSIFDVLINGVFSETLAFFTNTAGAWFKFGFTEKRVINAFKLYQDITVSHGTWKMQGSDDDSSWTDLGSSFTLTGSAAGTEMTFTNTTSYHYYRCIHVSGSISNAPWVREIELKISPTLNTLLSYSNTLGSGDRDALITITQTTGMIGGTVSTLVDGTVGTSAFFNSGAGSAGDHVTFDFGSAKTVNGMRWYQTHTSPVGFWKLRGSNDNSSFTDLTIPYALGGQHTGSGSDTLASERTFVNSTAYRYLRVEQVSGSRTTVPWLSEVEFRISA